MPYRVEYKNITKVTNGLPAVWQHPHDGEQVRNRNQARERRIGLKFVGFIVKY
ncbi:hypothetical protein HMPREF9418_2476 [Neisseria macacae ATCC 33926]|uniref:Uncharacterized protein n=2 Tax=Neisseria TaxID=482 RepID=I2NWH7_NEISI|nr:hypothetical protein HMPREF9418_2476 [Neisseria macacae ATCC 33926]EIG30188.1 hypothetical protein HMPREF1051_1011 [Neisseria sicca VK64]